MSRVPALPRPPMAARLLWLAMLLVVFSHALLPTSFRPVLVQGSAFSAATADNAILPQPRLLSDRPFAVADRDPEPGAAVALVAMLVLGLTCLLPAVIMAPAPLRPEARLRPQQLTPAHGPRAPPHA